MKGDLIAGAVIVGHQPGRSTFLAFAKDANVGATALAAARPIQP